MRHRILFVDDEKFILKSMERIFARSPFQLFFAESGEEALEIVKEREMSVIISDMKMPGMTGVEFLKSAADISPDTVRIILSAYSDIKDILSAVNQGHVHNYITKPWENERLKITVYNGTITYEKNIQVKNMADDLKDKNIQLNSLKDELEKTLQRRTRELSLRNKLLMNLLTEPDYKQSMKYCLEEIGRFANNRRLHLHCPGKIMFQEDMGEERRDAPPLRILSSCESIRKPSYVNDYLVIPLADKEDPAYLIVYPMDDASRKYLPEIISLSTIVKLILKQNRNLESSRELIDSYEDLMEDLRE